MYSHKFWFCLCSSSDLNPSTQQTQNRVALNQWQKLADKSYEDREREVSSRAWKSSLNVSVSTVSAPRAKRLKKQDNIWMTSKHQIIMSEPELKVQRQTFSLRNADPFSHSQSRTPDEKGDRKRWDKKPVCSKLMFDLKQTVCLHLLGPVTHRVLAGSDEGENTNTETLSAWKPFTSLHRLLWFRWKPVINRDVTWSLTAHRCEGLVTNRWRT